MRVVATVFACLIVALLPSAAQENPPEIRQFDIPMIEKLGHDMYVQDQAAWHATDALFSAHTRAELESENVRGWIIEPDQNGPVVRFVRDGESGLEAAYDIRMVQGAPIVSVSQDRHLSEDEKAQFAARVLALKSMTVRCGDAYNVVALKDFEGDGWLVWVLSATSRSDLVMVGGHRRFTISADGKIVLRNDALSRSCFTMQRPADRPEKKLAAAFVTQLVANIPVETYVFLTLQHHFPFLVATPDRTIWAVSEGSISKQSVLPERK